MEHPAKVRRLLPAGFGTVRDKKAAADAKNNKQRQVNTFLTCIQYTHSLLSLSLSLSLSCCFCQYRIHTLSFVFVNGLDSQNGKISHGCESGPHPVHVQGGTSRHDELVLFFPRESVQRSNAETPQQ